MLEVGEGTIPGGSGDETTAYWHVLQPRPSFNPVFGLNSQIWANKCGDNGMVMNLSDHPQHMNIVIYA